jgi:hypothetical protein
LASSAGLGQRTDNSSPCRFHERWVMSWLAEWLLASQEGLCSMERKKEFCWLTEIAFLAYLLKVEAWFLVMVCRLTPGTAQGNNFLGTEWKFWLEWLQ